MAPILCVIFFVSGASALLFETLWFRQAGLMLGNTVWASSLVTAAFMGGLAAGNVFAARVGGRMHRPVLAYAALEILIGVTGVGLVLLFPTLTSAIAPLLSPVVSQAGFLNTLRLLAAFLLLVIPSSAMGATLPLLVRVLARSRANFGRALGELYGWNTFGAVAGALAGEGFLIEALGVRGTAFMAGGLNLGAAAAAALVAQRLQPTSAAPAQAPPVGQGRRGLAIAGAAFLSGALLLALEVVWFRFLLLFVYGTSIAFALMLAAILMGIAAGGLIASIWLRLQPDGHRFAALVALLGGTSVALSYSLFTRALAPYGSQLIVSGASIFMLSLWLMLPTCLSSGLLFTLLGRALNDVVPDETRAAGLVTLANTVGAMLGALGAGFFLLPRAGMERSFFLLTCGYAFSAALLFGAGSRRPDPQRRERLAFRLAGALFALVVILFPFGLMERRYIRVVSDRWTRDGSRIAAVQEGLTETVVLFRKDLWGQPVSYRLVTNGMGMSGTDHTARRYMGLFVWWPVAVHPNPEKALLISYGLGTTARALTDTPTLKSIDVVDVSAGILEVSRAVFRPPRAHPLDDPRVRVHVEDGRFFLLTSRQSYDIITAEPPPPKSAGIVNLYSREYFDLIRERLAPGGIATYWLPVYHLEPAEARSIIRAFCGALDDCSLWTGFGFEWMLVGTRGANGPVSEELFGRQWRDPLVGSELRAAGLDSPEHLGALFLADAAALRSLTAADPLLEDDHPYRLSPRPFAGDLRFYSQLMEAETARRRFAESDLIRRLWPPSLRARALDWWNTQAIMNWQFSARNRLAPLPDLEALLTRSNVHSPILWLMGSSAEEQQIARLALARGEQDPMLQEILGVGAMADRDYRRAEEHLAGAEPHAAHAELLRKWRILALGLAGNTPGAAALLEEARPLVLRPGADLRSWEWLASRFGLALPQVESAALDGP